MRGGHSNTAKISWRQKQELARQGLAAATELRMRLDADLFDPICPYQICERLGIRLRFASGGLEGVYLPGDPPRIVLSVDRPLSRRRFTCAHEIGHHQFGHRATLDELREDAHAIDNDDPDEFLVNAFAGHLLMPVMGIRTAFRRRGADPNAASIATVLAVASEFGVGFDTLLTHLAFALKDIQRERRDALLKERAAFRNSVLDGRAAGGGLVLIDRRSRAATLDLEVGHWVLAPLEAKISGIVLESHGVVAGSQLLSADKKGRGAIALPDAVAPIEVLSASRKFIGLAEYRHLDDENETEE